jgi:RAB protein geranylgeranyltransferase component A
MGPIRNLGAGLVVAVVMAGGLGVANLEAKDKSGSSSNDAICAYLQSIIDYPYTSPAILAYAYVLSDAYGCTTN